MICLAQGQDVDLRQCVFSREQSETNAKRKREYNLFFFQMSSTSLCSSWGPYGKLSSFSRKISRARRREMSICANDCVAPACLLTAPRLCRRAAPRKKVMCVVQCEVHTQMVRNLVFVVIVAS